MNNESSDAKSKPQRRTTKEAIARVRNKAAKAFRERGPRPSLKTRRRYLASYRHMRDTGKSPANYLGSRSTFYAMRAAWTYGVAVDIVATTRALGRPDYPADAEAVRAVLDRLPGLYRDLQAYPPDPDRLNRDKDGFIGEFTRLAPGTSAHPNSKRAGLARLPAGWRDQVVMAAIDAGSKYVLGIAAASTVGCRPRELEMGVEVTAAEDDRLSFLITGAKYKPDLQGQEWRQIRLPVQGIDTQVIRDAVAAAGGTMTIRVPSAKGLGWAVSHFAEKAFPDDDYGISAYSMRHQLGADLKAEGWKRSKIAMALGHLVDRTCGLYGRRYSGTATRQLEVAAASTVRPTTWPRIAQDSQLASSSTPHRPCM
ncbi:MAG: hypothetical protein IT518_04260 [Burkholderiales bacterium]|nr:hypothetical protein [Burkholderiales bacterium]